MRKRKLVKTFLLTHFCSTFFISLQRSQHYEEKKRSGVLNQFLDCGIEVLDSGRIFFFKVWLSILFQIFDICLFDFEKEFF
jgi:hypothetical protein